MVWILVSRDERSVRFQNTDASRQVSRGRESHLFSLFPRVLLSMTVAHIKTKSYEYGKVNGKSSSYNSIVLISELYEEEKHNSICYYKKILIALVCQIRSFFLWSFIINLNSTLSQFCKTSFFSNSIENRLNDARLDFICAKKKSTINWSHDHTSADFSLFYLRGTVSRSYVVLLIIHAKIVP